MNLVRKVFDLSEGVLRYNVVSMFKTLSPRGMIINITYKCNSRCIMCNIWKEKPKKELSLEDWKKVLKDPIFINIRDLTISGGEAFLYEDYVKLIKLMIDSAPDLRRLVLNTNGFLTETIIKNVSKIANYCKDGKIKLSVSVSIDGIGSDHNDIRRVKNGYEKAKKTLFRLISLAKDKGFFVGVSSVLMRKNIDKYDEIKRWFADNQIEHSFQLIGFHDTYVNNLDEEKDLGFKHNDKNKIVKILKKMSIKNNFGSFYWNDMYEMYKNKRRRMTPCPFLKDNLVIDAWGDVYYCLSAKPIGNFIEEKRSISEIYFDPKNINFRKKLWDNECKYCNSGCDIRRSIAYDFKKYIIFAITKLVKTFFNK